MSIPLLPSRTQLAKVPNVIPPRVVPRDYINPIKMWSADAAPLYEDKSLDFVFIDARHTYDMVILDIESWLPKVKDGGILAGDDYFDVGRGVCPEVVQAVDDYFGDSISVRGNSWMYQN